MDESERFREDVRANVEGLMSDADVQALSRIWVREITPHKYAYNFTWLGRPIIQFPQDMIALQEIVWHVKPEVIVETGIAHGGSLVYSASLLTLLGGDRFVVGVDVDIRAHNRREIEAHPMAARIRMIEGSSVDDTVAAAVRDHCRGKGGVLVILDSHHTHAHVLRELQLYGPLVTRGSYLIVLDTLIEDMPAEFFAGRPWGKGNNPKTAVHEFLAGTKRFEIDTAIPAQLLLTTAPDGYLRCIGE